jgi:O-antigen/teichoic acid export membrane protein
MIRRFAAHVFASSFLRHVTVLASGSLLANMISLALLPIFARMYDAGSFGLQSLLLLGVTFLSPLSTGYYDWAIPTPRRKDQARALATLAFGIALSIGALALCILVLFHHALAPMMHMGALGLWIFTIPLLAMCTGCYNIANYWLLRASRPGLQTNIRFAHAISTALFTLIFGVMKMKDGLLLGFICGLVFAAAWSLMIAYRHGLRLELHRSRLYFMGLASKFREFPIFGAIPAGVTNLAAQIPLLVITAGHAISLTGHYAVVRSIMFGGTALISAAFGQVILKHMAEHKHAGTPIWPAYIRIFALLALGGLALSITIYFISPWFFRLYLGAGWGDSTMIARMLSVNMMLWLMGPALSCAPIGLRILKPIAAWQISYFVMACCLFFFIHLPFEQLLARLVIFDLVAYGLYVAIATATVWRFGRAR